MLERSAPKAWRFVSEMGEIAATFEALGLPGGFHHAAADIYRRLEAHAEDPSPEASTLIQELLEAGAPAASSAHDG